LQFRLDVLNDDLRRYENIQISRDEVAGQLEAEIFILNEMELSRRVDSIKPVKMEIL